MPTKEQVTLALEQRLDYPAVGARLGISAGQAYLIATGLPADGGDVPGGEGERRWMLPASQDLVNPPHENPTGKESVREWMRRRVAADRQLREAAERRTAEPPEIREPDATTDAIVVLSRDHNQIKVMMKQLEALPSHRSGGNVRQMSMRKSIVDMMTVALSQHESVEEEYFWPTVRDVLTDGDALADGALQQEQEGKDTLTALGKLNGDTDEFDELVERLVLQLRKHVAYEEQVFLRLREAASQERLDDLGRLLAEAKEAAPTRPHPHAPQKPPEVKAAGAAAAAADKARDAAGDRPAKRKGKPDDKARRKDQRRKDQRRKDQRRKQGD